MAWAPLLFVFVWVGSLGVGRPPSFFFFPHFLQEVFLDSEFNLGTLQAGRGLTWLFSSFFKISVFSFSPPPHGPGKAKKVGFGQFLEDGGSFSFSTLGSDTPSLL